MYELKEYQMEIMPKIVFRTSHSILGEKLIKFPVRWYFGQNFKKAESREQRDNYY